MKTWLWRWLFGYRGDVSPAWLKSQRVAETKIGVDLPRWRFPRERLDQEAKQ